MGEQPHQMVEERKNGPACEKKEVFTFPCTYSLKVMGKSTGEFYSVVTSIIEEHVSPDAKITYSSKASNGDKYLSITATFVMESKQQMEAIYGSLQASGLVIMAL
jgi:uncharacterized protein